MNKFEIKDGAVIWETVTQSEGGQENIRDILTKTKTEQAILITDITGTQAIVALKEFVTANADKIILYGVDANAFPGDDLTRWNKASSIINVLMFVGFDDVSSYVSDDNYHVLVFRNENWADFKTRLLAYFSGACMAATSYSNLDNLTIFADCFAGGENGRVLDFMEQMCKALGHGKLSATIHADIEAASKIRKYTAERSSTF